MTSIGGTELLGIGFSTKLDTMIAIHFEKKPVNMARHISETPDTENLTPLGRIAIVNTLTLPLFSHIFMSISTPVKL